MGCDRSEGPYICKHDPGGHPQNRPPPVFTPSRTGWKGNFCKALQINEVRLVGVFWSQLYGSTHTVLPIVTSGFVDTLEHRDRRGNANRLHFPTTPCNYATSNLARPERLHRGDASANFLGHSGR